MDRIEAENYGGLSSSLLPKAKDDVEKANITAFIENMRSRCDVVTALRRSTPYAYMPADISLGRLWWNALTVERWQELLDEGELVDPSSEVTIQCVNPIISHLKGMVPVVKSGVQLKIQIPEQGVGSRLEVIREVPGSKTAMKTWSLNAEATVFIEDNEIPNHKGPLKYSASLNGATGKKASIRVVSMDGWLPGVVASATTATKGTLPKRSKDGKWDAPLLLSGQGRHYLDLYLRPGAELVSMLATGSNEDDNPDPSNAATIGMVADGEFGIEVEIEGECFF